MDAPIAALDEGQVHTRGAFSLRVQWAGDRLQGHIAAIGRDGDLPANLAEAEWIEAAADGLVGITRDWAPLWTIAPDDWPEFHRRLDARLSSRTFRLTSGDPVLVAQLSALLRGDWRVTLYWALSPTSTVQIDITAQGSLTLTGADPHLDALRAITGLALEAPTPTHRRLLEIQPHRTNPLFERVAAWSPASLAWIYASISGESPGR